MHNLNIDIDESLKEQVYQYVGFEFLNSPLLNQELNYENIFKAIDPGSEFRRICNDFELDIDSAVDNVKKYVLYLVIEEIRALKYANKEALMKIKNEEIKNQKIQDLLNEMFFKTPRDLFNTLHYIDGYFTPEQIKSKLDNEYESVDLSGKILTAQSKKKWKENSKKTGSFYSLYVKYATRKSRQSKSLVKSFNKITNFNQELLNKQEHFHQFNKSIKVARVDPSLDYWSFEYNTYSLMLQKISQYKALQNLRDEHFPVLASLLVVGDIRLKLSLVETFFDNASWSHLKNNLSNLFVLSIVIIPFFKEYTKNKLMEIVDKTILESNDELSDYNKDEMFNLRKQIYIYQILKTKNCYEGENLASEFNINFSAEVEVNEGLIKAWKHIEDAKTTINKNFKKLFKDFLNHLDDFLLIQNSEENIIKQEGLSINFGNAVETGIYEAIVGYGESIAGNLNKHDINALHSIVERNSGKFDEERIDNYWNLNEKE
ncbi:hypothetical protein P4605_10005 [Priestia aryabhattai]|uniref:hypothetical protein n=1 Tax=Priestia aryabhattai TaxID=412384 RepID=UPI002E1B2024|nr:hypothetical protein [Priestia aryabhattai]